MSPAAQASPVQPSSVHQRAHEAVHSDYASTFSDFAANESRLKAMLPSLARLASLTLPSFLLTKELLESAHSLDRSLGKLFAANVQKRPAVTCFTILVAIFSLVPIALFMFYLLCATFFNLAGFLVVEAAAIIFGLGLLCMTILGVAGFCFGTTVFLASATWALSVIAGALEIDLAASFTNFHVVRARHSPGERSEDAPVATNGE